MWGGCQTIHGCDCRGLWPGEPCCGRPTRVPVDVVLGSFAPGISLDRLKASSPFLTEAHIQSAKVYDEVHPRRGRPRRIADVNPGLPRRVTRVIKRISSS